MGLFSIIGTVGKALFGGGSKDSTKTCAPPDYSGQIAIMKAEAEIRTQEFARQRTAESAKQKNLLMALGGVAGIGMLYMMFVKK